MSEIVRGRTKGHLVVDNHVIDGLLEIGGINLAGFYIALKRFVDRRESADSNTAMPWTVDYFCQKFKMGKDRFYRLAEMLWGVGLLDVVKEYGSQKGAWGWRNRYAIHDDPGYEGPLRIIREGTFRCPKTGRARNSDTGIPRTKVLGIPAIGIPIAGREENKTYRKYNVVVATKHPENFENGCKGNETPTGSSRFPQNLPCRQILGVAGSERTELASEELIDPGVPNSISDNYSQDLGLKDSQASVNPDSQESVTLDSQTNGIFNSRARVQEEASANPQDNRGNGGTCLAKETNQINSNDNTSKETKDHFSTGSAREIQEAFIKATGQPLTGRALEELMNYPLEYVLTKIAMVEVGKEKINAPGWLLEACREDYQHLPGPKQKRALTRSKPPKLNSAKDDKYRELYRLV